MCGFAQGFIVVSGFSINNQVRVSKILLIVTSCVAISM